MSPLWKSGAVMDGKEERRRQGRQIEAGGLPEMGVYNNNKKKIQAFFLLKRVPTNPQNPSGAVTGVTISGNLRNKADSGCFVYRSKVRSSLRSPDTVKNHRTSVKS